MPLKGADACENDGLCAYFGVFRAADGAGTCTTYGPDCAYQRLDKSTGEVQPPFIFVNEVMYQFNATAECPCGVTGSTDLYRLVRREGRGPSIAPRAGAMRVAVACLVPHALPPNAIARPTRRSQHSSRCLPDHARPACRYISWPDDELTCPKPPARACTVTAC